MRGMTMARRQDNDGGNNNDNEWGGANKDDNDGDIFHCTVTDFSFACLCCVPLQPAPELFEAIYKTVIFQT